MQEPYLQNFVEASLQALGDGSGRTLVIGGDGRFFNREAAQIIVKMSIAHGYSKIIIAKDALLSTPAASALIRERQPRWQAPAGAFILSASHNPGGIDCDFGLKVNGANGGPAPEQVQEKHAH